MGFFVVDSCEGVGRDTIIECAEWPLAKLRPHPKTVPRLPNGLNNDISSLANDERDDIRCEGLYGYKVLGNYSELVAINAELLYTLGTSVDETKEMLLARLKPEFGNACIWCAG
jgi:hypothetical protein